MPDIQEGDRVISAWDHISDSLGWLYEYAGKCIDRQILAIRKQLKNADVAVLDFNFPTICEMYPLTEDEQYNINHHITGDWIFSYKYDDEEQKQFYKLYGRDFQTLSKELPYYDRTREGIFQTCPTYKSENSENPLHVYLFGPCISIQTDLPEENKLIHLLQEHLNRDFPGKYSVESIRIQVERFPFYSEVFQRMKLMAGDVVIFLSDSNDFGRGAVSLKSFFVQERKGGTLVFSNAPIHILPHMSEKLAEHIYSTYLKKQILSSIVKNADRIALFPEHLEDNQVEAIQKYVAAYTDQICEDGGVTGAIVMNCNPFTKGHLYLIEQARKQVDTLYIFVVEEDRSEFSFQERYAMVQENTKDMEDVVALPSGKMVLSASTFVSYFQKEEKQEIQVDPSLDVLIFALGIAPAFHITRRFVGEEPFDTVTKQYNESMQEILPHYGIEVVEIPRVKYKIGDSSTSISATEVRKLGELKQWEDLKKIVPKASFPIIYEHYVKCWNGNL